MVLHRNALENKGPLVAKSFLIALALAGALGSSGEGKDIYNPHADARADISTAVAKAKQEGKNVLIQVGGNWCKWCLRLEKLMRSDEEVGKLLDQFVYIHVNYSDENKNPEVLAELGYPQRFGFPVLLVLDAQGKLVHTQDSAFLEKGNGHDPKMVARFLEAWTPKALQNPGY